MPLIDPSEHELDAIRALADFAGRSVVEIGTGDGRLAWPFAPEAALWLALDPDPEELAVATTPPESGQAVPQQAADRAAGGPVRCLVADGRALCLADEAFDIGFFTWSLC